MHSISAILIKTFTKPFIKAGAKLFCISLLFITQTTHADFRKALDAYMARDGATMLKEVKDAVGKKNDDGLMLLLMATNVDAATSDYDETTKQSKSTLRAILPQPKWDEMGELLVQATNNSTVDAQYFFITASQFRIDANTKIANEYFLKGSHLATFDSTIATISDKAEAGNLEAQLALGFRYLNYENEFGCEKQSKDPLCKSKDESKGYYWLKRAVKTYEMSGNADFDLLPSVMCEFYRKTASGDQAKLKQAYLWALKGANEVGSVSSSRLCLTKIYESQELKLTSPEVYIALSDKSNFNSMVYRSDLKELPEWIVEVRKEMAKQKLPVFTYHFGPVLDIYADGHVLLGFANYPKDMLMKVKPKVVRAFLSELKKVRFYEWTSANFSAGYCPDFDPCGMMDMHLSLRDGAHIKRFYLGLLNEKSQTLDWKYTNRKKMAIIKSLVEKYFPTQKLRCGLGSSEVRRQTCVEFDSKWLKIAEKGE